MIKECKILSYNKFLNILVFEYNGRSVQITATLEPDHKTVFVRYKLGKYEIVSKSEYEKYIRNSKKKEMSIKDKENENT